MIKLEFTPQELNSILGFIHEILPTKFGMPLLKMIEPKLPKQEEIKTEE